MRRHHPTRDQLPLFELAPEGRSDGLDSAEVDPVLEAVAEKLPAQLRFGTSSWSFPGWKGIVYRGDASAASLAREGLAVYARHPLLRAAGVDRTYYSPIPTATFREYASCVPAGFRFLVKCPSTVTSPFARGQAAGRQAPQPAFLDPETAIREIVEPASDGLGQKLGVLLFQFEPLSDAWTREPRRFLERLHRFLAAIPRGIPRGVELRNRELLGEAYFDILGETGTAHCINVHPTMPRPREQAERLPAMGPLVIRWMLHEGFDYAAAKSRYSPFSRLVDEDPATRSEIAELCVAAARTGRETLVIANNKAEGCAPLTLFKLASEIARSV